MKNRFCKMRIIVDTHFFCFICQYYVYKKLIRVSLSTLKIQEAKMKKGRAILGLPIYELENGRQIGKVVDILYTAEASKVLGMMTEIKAEHLPEMRFIYYDDIAEMENHALKINSEEALHPPHVLKNKSQISYSTSLLYGQQVFDEQGKELGTIRDVVLDLNEGIIDGYQLSHGIIADLVSGRNVIPVGSVLTMGKDMVVIQDWVKE